VASCAFVYADKLLRDPRTIHGRKQAARHHQARTDVRNVARTDGEPGGFVLCGVVPFSCAAGTGRRSAAAG